MRKQIFKDPKNQELFDKQGFIILPFLEQMEIQKLEDFFERTHPHIPKDQFFSDSYLSDFNFKKDASEFIVSVFDRAYQNYFMNYQPFGGSFLFKSPGANSALAAHQDWTIVDENEEYALNCWVPLCDIDENNGALMILPGSHFDNFPSLRAPTLPFFFHGNEEIVQRNLVPMYVKAGMAVVLNQSVIHYSQPNTSSHVRKAITAGIKSFGAQMIFHYKVPNEDAIEVFDQEDLFLIQFENFAQEILERPKRGKFVEKKPFSHAPLSKSEMELLTQQMKRKAGYEYIQSNSKKGLLSKLIQLISRKK
jgi:hypothetical protein